MPGLFSWYNNSYASWNRMRRIHTTPFIAHTDSRTSRTATAMHNGTDVTAASGNNPNAGANAGDVVINMADLSLGSPLPLNKDNKDTLFGPSIGVVNTAPEWCATDAELDEKVFKNEKELELDEKDEDSDVDELTPEIVKEWVRRSKEPSEPTTTLQALVNLKRPSIRLSPLAAPDSSSTPSPDESTDALAPGKHHQQHGLEFEFDCDAPQCFISLHAVGVPASLGDPDEQQHHDTLQVPGSGNASVKDKENDRLVLFEMALPGGFVKKLTLADGAVLELAKLEAAAKAHRTQLAAAAAASAANSANASKVDLSITSAPARDEHHRKRHTFFKKRGHLLHHSHHSNSQPGSETSTPPREAPAVATGPALAVVDAEAPPLHPNGLSAQNQNALATFFAGGDAERARQKKDLEEEGVRIAIRLAARDADGRAMRVRNEQVTYLHIVRQGPPAASTTITGAAEDAATGSVAAADGEQVERRENTRGDDDEKEKEDTRPWVVRVVKREARIGAHSFQLHEIYGLTAHATAPDAAHQPDSVTPSSPTAPVEHTYPPTPGQPQTQPSGGETEDSPAECLLCLSAAREVVLLPCRHLVACRECAVNMVEFGAGGTVAQPMETEAQAAPAAANTVAGSGAGENTGENNGQEQVMSAAPAPTTPTPATRRKRKAKGWFCPVCRQPYTSLLRITTAPPPLKGAGLPHSVGDVSSGDAKRVSLASSIDAEADSSPSNNSNSASVLSGSPPRPLATVAESGATSVNEDPAQAGNNNAAGNANVNGMESRGAFASLTSSGFLRHFSGRARERDSERGAAAA